ncbi:MAG: TniQ family protein [Rhodocyclaceae bacterium]|nr:TniQ family protein [Rhodocyclaceae bacterium]
MLPMPFPDETLYGLIARTNRLRGDSTGTATSLSLFGHPTVGLSHDVPCHLDYLSQTTHGLLGTALEISSALTTIPYFLRFKPLEIELHVHEAIRGPGLKHFKHQLGLPPAPCRASLPLYACPQCMAEDVENHGIASWRRVHQLPGSLFCVTHAQPLLEAKERVRRKQTMLLPEDIETFVPSALSLEMEHASVSLLRLARLNRDILENPLPRAYLRSLLPQVYRQGLRAHGLLTASGRIRVNEYLHWLRAHFGTLSEIRPFCYALSHVHADTLLRMVRKPRADFHPIYHALLIDAIFGGWAGFVQAYAWETCIETQDVPSASDGSSVPAHIASFIAALREAQPDSSIRNLAGQYGVDISTGMRWAGKLGVLDLPRRPRILHHELKQTVIQALLRGEPQRDIAKSTGLSRATVDRVCQEQPELHAAWRRANQERKRSNARQSILAYIDTHPMTTLAEAHRLSPPGYCWLRRHDPAWLRHALPSRAPTVTQRILPNRPIVDWSARDRLCFKELSQMACTVSFESWERIKAGTLLGKLPTLPFLPRLERLPRSKRLVDQILLEHRAKRIQLKRTL